MPSSLKVRIRSFMFYKISFNQSNGDHHLRISDAYTYIYMTAPGSHGFDAAASLDRDKPSLVTRTCIEKDVDNG